MKIYRIVTGKNLKELEIKVSQLLNKGWETAGSISFNQNFPYQAMIGEAEAPQKRPNEPEIRSKQEPISAIESMKRIDKLL